MNVNRMVCHEGGNIHAWESTGLDNNRHGVLVNGRRCVWCGKEQEKRYGAGSRRGWNDRPVRPDSNDVA